MNLRLQKKNFHFLRNSEEEDYMKGEERRPVPAIEVVFLLNFSFTQHGSTLKCIKK